MSAAPDDAWVLVELLLLALAVACAASVRPWRLLRSDSPHDLAGPSIVLGVLLPLLWWRCSLAGSGPLALLGAQLAMLVLGWPLAVLLVACSALAVLLLGVGADTVVLAAFWNAVAPITVALAGGALVRMTLGQGVVPYLLARALLIPFIANALMGWLAGAWTGRYDRFGDDATAVVLLVSMAEASMTFFAVTLLAVYSPRALATWKAPRTEPGAAPRPV